MATAKTKATKRSTKSKSIVSAKARQAVIDPEYTGGLQDSGRVFPPVISILSSDKQYKVFGDDGDKITKGMYGKLFIRSRSQTNTLDDLKDTIEGTVIKIQMGAEFKDRETGKFLGNVGHIMNAQERDAWLLDHPTHRVDNVVKIILALGTPKEAAKVMQSGGNPFCLLVIKRSSWGAWFEAKEAMNNLTLGSEEYGNVSADRVLVSAFRLEIGSQKESNDKHEWYSYTLQVKLNSVEDAALLADAVLQAKDTNLFDTPLREGELREVFAQLEDKPAPVVAKQDAEYEAIGQTPLVDSQAGQGGVDVEQDPFQDEIDDLLF